MNLITLLRYCCIFLYLYLYGKAQGILSIAEMQSRIISPVKHSITLSGSYGELRSTHFHAGIDIRPSSESAEDKIFAIDDGYVSRARVQTGGFGKALYIVHPATGYTTVYAHLDRFNDELDQLISKAQYSRKSYAVNLDFPRNFIPVKKGQFIGIMGNTGQSFGTHLHFEIRDSKTENPLNPILFRIKPKDHIPPVISAIAVHGLDRNFHKSEQIIVSGDFASNDGTNALPVIDIVSDRAGVAIEAYDMMNGAPNKNGIYRMRLYDDKGLRYFYEMNRFSFSESSHIAGFIDYGQKQTSGNTFALCYRLPSLKLSFLDNNLHGIFQLEYGSLHYFCIEAEDIESNTTTFEAYIRRIKSESLQALTESEEIMEYGKYHVFERDSCKVTLHEESLFRNIRFEYEMVNDSICNPCYRVHQFTEPVKKAIDIRLLVPEWLNEYADKLIVIRYDPKGKKINHGGKIGSGTISISSRFFGLYALAIDTIPPHIRPINFNAKAQGMREFTFEIKDDLDTAGNAKELTYQVEIDGKFVVCPYKSLTGVLQVPLSGIVPGKHQLKIKATDHSGNSRIYRASFVR